MKIVFFIESHKESAPTLPHSYDIFLKKKSTFLPRWPISSFLGFFLLITACTPPEDRAPLSTRPNILFILADDHTTQAISAYGGKLAPYAKTQHIDQLASEGMLFTHCFSTNSICSPSRASILTGTYSHVNGVHCLNQRFDSTQQTSATVLQQAGYQTAVFGKWHLKSQPVGFDPYKVLEVQGRYQDPQFRESDTDSLVTYPGWSTDIITHMTTEFLSNRDPHKPFFVMCQYKTTHDPWASRPPYDTLFSQIDLPEPDNLYDTYENRSEAAKRTTLKLEMINQGTYPHDRLPDGDWKEQRGHIYQQYIKDFLRCGRVLDENVGRLMQYLEETGLAENTVVVYTADQGHFLGEHGFFSKRFMYDESMRMPLIIRSPLHEITGKVNEDLIANVDLAPTLLDIAGVSIPQRMQGRSILPILEGATPTDWRTAIYYRYWQHLLHRNVPAHLGIRTKAHKLIFYYGQPLGFTDFEPTPPEWEYFDLVQDPREMFNAYGDEENEEVIEELKGRLKKLRIQYSDTDELYSAMPAMN